MTKKYYFITLMLLAFNVILCTRGSAMAVLEGLESEASEASEGSEYTVEAFFWIPKLQNLNRHISETGDLLSTLSKFEPISSDTFRIPLVNFAGVQEFTEQSLAEELSKLIQNIFDLLKEYIETKTTVEINEMVKLFLRCAFPSRQKLNLLKLLLDAKVDVSDTISTFFRDLSLDSIKSTMNPDRFSCEAINVFPLLMQYLLVSANLLPILPLHDRTGDAVMHSFIIQYSLAKNEIETAREHYTIYIEKYSRRFEIEHLTYQFVQALQNAGLFKEAKECMIWLIRNHKVFSCT